MKTTTSAVILLYITQRTRQLGLQNTLNQTPHRILTAANLTAYWTIIEREQPALVIADFVSADFMAGEQIVQAAQRNRATLLAIVQNTDESISRAIACGVDDCLIDPVHPMLLLQRIQHLLNARLPTPPYPPTDELDTKHRRLLDSANDAMFIMDMLTGKIMDVNRTACRWLGYTREEFLNMKFDTIELPTHPDQGKKVIEALSTTGHFIFEQEYRTKSGKVIPAEVSSRITQYEGRRVVLSFARDVSQRRLIEQSEFDQRRLVNALRDTAAALSSTLDLNEVMERIIQYVTVVVPAEVANIMLVENGTATIYTHWGYDRLGIDVEPTRGNWEVDETPSMLWMVQQRQPLLIGDIHTHPGWQARHNNPIHAYLGAPIIVEEHVIGFINLSHRVPDSFTAAHATNLQAFANQASIAIQNAQLHAAIRRHAESLEARVAERTLELIQLNLNMKEQVVERQRIEEALQEERNLLRTLIDNIPDEIYVKDRMGRYVLANRAFVKRVAHRAPNGEVIGTTLYDYIGDDDTAALTDLEFRREQALMEAGTGFEIAEMPLFTPDAAGERWFHTIRLPLHDSQNKVIGLVGVNRDITQRKEDEERINHIISGAYCLLWYAIVEDNGLNEPAWSIFISNDESAQRFLPVTIQPGQDYREAWHASILPEDRTMMYNNSRTALRSGAEGYSQEFRCRRIDGEIRWLREEVQIKPLMPGRFSLVGVCTDITERKNAEETLQRANELLELRVKERTAELSRANDVLLEQIAERNRAEQAEREQRKLAEALSDAAASFNETLDVDEVLDRVLTYAARVMPPHEYASVMMIENGDHVRVIRARSYSQQSIAVDLSHQAFPLDSLPNLCQIIATGQPMVIDDAPNNPYWVALPGREFVRSYLGVPIFAEGAVIGFINLASQEIEQFNADHARRLVAFSNQAGIAIQNARLFDAVRRHAGELQQRVAERTAELEQERGQLNAILNAMTDGVVFYDHQGQARYINRSLAELTGYPLDDWLNAPDGWPPGVMPHAEIGRIRAEMQEGIAQQGIWHGDVKMGRKDQSSFDAKLVTTLVLGPDGYPTGTVLVIRDVSAEKRLEEQKARFIATASHELRTPIANLKTRLYLIKRQPEKLEQHLEVLTFVTDRMQKLVEDLLDISRFEHNIISLEKKEVDLQALVSSVIQVQRPEATIKNITINEFLSSDRLLITADESRMAQVITNLITNAINYTPEGGRIDVEVTADTDVANDSSQRYGYVRVCDTGIGIPAELVPQVFKPFFRVNDYSSGMGLGLSITKEIVELHRGEILVESEVNQGTCFVVKLPLSKVVTGETVKE